MKERQRSALRAAMALALTLGAALPACRRRASTAPPDPAQVIATYDGGTVTRGDIEAGFGQRLGHEPGASPERQAELLRRTVERRVRAEILYREAVASGLPQRAGVRAGMRAIEERLLAEDWLATQAASAKATPAQVDGELQRRSSAAPEELRRFSHLFVRAAENDAAARARARETMAAVRKQLDDGTPFEDLARRYSDSVTARAGGKVEWTRRAPLHDAVEPVVFGLVEGQVSEVVATESGLHLFRLDGIRRPMLQEPATLRAEVQTALDQEAVQAAIQAQRQRTFDQSGIVLDERVLARPATPGTLVATVAGEAITRDELEAVRQFQSPPPAALELARALCVNRLLAQKRRAQPIGAELAKRVSDAQRNLILDTRRSELIATIDTAVSAQEEEQFYAQNRESATYMKDHVVDLLFFAQTGSSQAGVYGHGEDVNRRLRAGESFGRILEAQARAAVVGRRVAVGDLDSLREHASRLSKEIARLAPGEVSSAVYLDGERLAVGGRNYIADRGVVFVRLVEVRAQPFAQVRARIHELLRRQKEASGVATIQQRLMDASQLKLLVEHL